MNRPFALLVLVTIVTEFACNLPTGAMPLALLADGSPHPAIVLALGAGTFANLLGSIPVGFLVDRIGRLVTIRIATIAMAASTLGMALTHGVVWGGIFMALRGISLTSYVTAEFAYTAEIVPPARAVSAISFFGLVANTMFAISPSVGVWLWNHGVGREQFLFATAASLVGAAALWFLPSRHDVSTGARSRTILMRSAWLPTMSFLIASSIVSGVNVSLAVLTFTHRGLANGALIFAAMALTTAAVRYPAGRLVDRYGARPMAIPVALATIAGCLLAANAYQPLQVIVAGACSGIAWGMIVPVGIGLFFERSGKRTRGAAMGAYNFSFSLGGALGTGIASIFVAIGWGYPGAMLLAAVTPILTAPLLFLPRKKKRSTGMVPQAGA